MNGLDQRTRAADSRASRPVRRPPLVPHQHGAWAFLALPLALGGTVTGWSPVLLLLAWAWVAAYPLSWALAELASARRPERYRRAAILWSAVAAIPVLALVALRPWLWVAGLVYAVLFGVNLGFAKAGAERSLANDLVLVAECTAMVPLMLGVATGGDGAPVDAMVSVQIGVLCAVCAMTLAGSTLHVKSLIRERRNPLFAWLSRGFAVACVPVAVLCALAWGAGGAWLVPPFVLLAARTWVPAMRVWRPARVGLVELVGFVLVAVSAGIAA
jgi:hypothetical protein